MPSLPNAAQIRMDRCPEAVDRTLEVREGVQTVGFRFPGHAGEVFGKFGERLRHIGAPLLGLSPQNLDQSLARVSQGQDILPQLSQMFG